MDFDSGEPKSYIVSGAIILTIVAVRYVYTTTINEDYSQPASTVAPSGIAAPSPVSLEQMNQVDARGITLPNKSDDSEFRNVRPDLSGRVNQNPYTYPAPPSNVPEEHIQKLNELDRQQTEEELIALCRKYILSSLSLNGIDPTKWYLGSYQWHHQGKIAWVEIRGNYNGIAHRYAFEIHLEANTYKIIYCQELPPV